MQPRSKSAQDRKFDGQQHDLRLKLYWLSHHSRPLPPPPILDSPSQPPKSHCRQHQLPLHSLQFVESFENIELAKMRTAIGELQALAASNSNQGTNLEWTAQVRQRQPNAESIVYQEPYNLSKIKVEHDESMSGQNQSMNDYIIENGRLKESLKAQIAINSECQRTIKRLENSNHQLQREISALLQQFQTHQAPDTQRQRIKQLEKDMKQQVIINLKLEEMMLRNKLKEEKREEAVGTTMSESQLKAMIKELKLQITQLRYKNKKEVEALIRAIQIKDKEILQLKKSLKISQTKEQYYPITFQNIESPQNPAQLFDNQLEKRMQVIKNFTSTSPSLQDAIDGRKKSDSLSSKEINYLNIAVPIVQRGGNRAVSKTDRH